MGDIKYPCTISRTIITQFLKPGNLSMSDLQEMLLLGLELSFLSFRCKGECEVKGLECDVNYGSHTVQCYKRMSNVYFYPYSCIYFACKHKSLITNNICLIGLILQVGYL